MDTLFSTGRRKTAVARIYLKEGNGNIIVNNKDFQSYFPSDVLQTIIRQPLAKIEKVTDFDIKVNVFGGGVTGQAEAVRLAIARVLVKLDENFRPPLKVEGFLTRDPRMVERKKYGRRKARRKFQFSKR